MNEYRIIHDMKMKGKSLVVLDRKREIDDMNKSKAIVGGSAYSFSLTHHEASIIIDTLDELNGKTIHFE